MILKITHVTTYTYEKKIFAEPHYLLFHPQQREYLKLLNFDMVVDPEPVLLSRRQNIENNTAFQCIFDEKIDHLKITAEFQVELAPFNPFNFYLDRTLYDPEEENSIVLPYIDQKNPITGPLLDWVNISGKKIGDEEVKLVSGFNELIGTKWNHTPRYSDDLLTPEDTFQRQKASCRDLSWLLIHILRHLKIPARFVSGYAFNHELGEGHELHAWVEAWLPGAGWVGVDPSTGLWTGREYIPVATSFHPKWTMPVVGKYRGEAKATLKTKVTIKVLEE